MIRKDSTTLGVFLLLAWICSCTPVRMIAIDGSDGDVMVSPRQAMDAARPHLDMIFHIRCNRRPDKSWCAKPSQDFIARQGDWYCISRESYPYKTTQAYWDPCVRVHVQSGRVVLPTLPDI